MEENRDRSENLLSIGNKNPNFKSRYPPTHFWENPFSDILQILRSIAIPWQ